MNRFAGWACGVVFVAVQVLGVPVRAAEDGEGAGPDRLVISVAGVSAREGTGNHWGVGMTMVLADRLQELGALKLRSTMRGRRALGLKRGDPFTKDQAVKIGLLVESQRILHGSVGRTEDGWNVRMAVVTPATESEETFELTAKDWWAACDETTRKLMDLLKVQPDEGEEENVFRRWTDSPEALEAALRASGRGIERKNPDEAEALMRKAVDADGNSAALWAGLSTALLDQGKTDEAEQAVRRALALDPDTVSAHLVLGYVESSRDNAKLAEGCFRKALQIQPDCQPALKFLSMQLAENPDRQQEALAMLRRAKRVDPTYGQVFSVESAILAGLGRSSEAEASLREAIRLAAGEPPLFNDELFISKAAMALRDLPLVVTSTRRVIEAEQAGTNRPEILKELKKAIARVEARMEPVPVEAEMPRSLSPEKLQEELKQRLTAEELTRVEIPISVTPEMVSWAAKWLEGADNDLEKARALFTPMAQRGGDRRTSGARTAKAVFALWNEPGNRFSCQEFAKLYVGLARELGLEAFMAKVRKDYQGDFVYHVCAAVLVDDRCYLADPTYLWFGIPHREFTVLDDLEVVALHCSQQGDRVRGSLLSENAHLPDCRVAEKLDPDEAYIKLAIAYCLYSLDRSEEAKEALDAAEGIQPERWDVRWLRGMIAAKEGAEEEAQRWIEEALRLNPKAGNGHYMLGELLAKKGELVEGREHLRKALAYGASDSNKERARQGIARINEFIGQSPEAPVARGLRLVERDDWEGAAGEFQRAVDEQPESEHAHGRLGIALVNLGRLPEGIEHLRRAVELNSKGLALYRVTLATVLYKEEGFEAARAVLDEGLALNPDAIKLHQVMGQLLLKENRVSESIDSYRKVLAAEPDNTLAAIGLAAIHVFSGQPAMAEEVLSGVELTELEEPRQLLQVAMIILNIGDIAMADQLMRRVRDLATSANDEQLMAATEKGLAMSKGVFVLEERLLVLLRSGAEGPGPAGEIDKLLELLEGYGRGGALYIEDEDVERCFAKRRDEVMQQLGERETTTITVTKGNGAQERVDGIRTRLVGGASVEEAAGAIETAEMARIGARGWNMREDFVPAMRTPVFATKVGGVTEVIDGGKFFAVVVVHASRLPEGPLSLEDDSVRSVVDGFVQRERLERRKVRTLERLRERVRKERDSTE